MTEQGFETQTEQTAPKLSFDGKQYKLDDMSPRAQSLVRHILNINQKLEALQFDLEELHVTSQSFEDLLRIELKKGE